jgi:hypothetical protein
MLAVEFLVGALMLAVGSLVFWRIGQPDGLSPRLRTMPGIESLVVPIVLGGWAGGASFIIHAVFVLVVQ